MYRVADAGSDLDAGVTGIDHNFPLVGGTELNFCLFDCDASTDPICVAHGPAGAGTPNGSTFGPPLPLFAAGVPVCVRSDFADPVVQATVNVQTGEWASEVDGQPTPLRLDLATFVTAANKVCPECVDGRCDAGPRSGAACVVEGSVRVVNPSQGVDQRYALSSRCPPGGTQGMFTSSSRLELALTTGTARLAGPKPCPGQTRDDSCATFGAACTVDCSAEPDVKGGLNQWCCSDAARTPCFPTAADSGDPEHAIVRVGTSAVPEPPWPDPTFPKTAVGTRLVAVSCLPSYGLDGTIEGLGGQPVAVILDGTLAVER